MSTTTNIFVCSSYYIPGFKGGGPIRTIANMIDRLGNEFKFYVYTSDRDLGERVPYATIQSNVWQSVGNANVFYASPERFPGFRLWRQISNFQGNILNVNSFFSLNFSILPLIIWRILKPNTMIIIGPRGEFSKGALSFKSTKKKLFLTFAKKLGVYNKVIWHASSDFEATDIRCVMGNHVRVRVAIDISSTKAEITIKERTLDAPLRIIFLSRISPMKNLLGAIEVLKKVNSNVIFDVFGPTEDKLYWKSCQKAAKSLPSNIKFRYCGTLQPMEVLNRLAEYDLFFLPTLGENFGHVIAEALSSGLPVLISDATPWRDLAEKSLGWDISLSQIDKFSECIEVCATKSASDYLQWRQSIRTWALGNVGNHEAIEQNRCLFMTLDSQNEY
ncbi:glycosyltransferase family 4 protein [Malikia spinosa]|uniref:Glycosyltransferase family 4 protein n=1 Tax=Malikia spinosa TaxID=86180 RepID=A0A7C9MY97_9BURK|nr:glycosyltransferase family 4 protein [Malikia spinosa]MYZ53001.1 glycosyltransferase family 4 protein [Malikia spinosa]